MRDKTHENPPNVPFGQEVDNAGLEEASRPGELQQEAEGDLKARSDSLEAVVDCEQGALVERPHLDHIVALTERPEPPEDEILGFHCTSISALDHVSVNGYFPTTGAYGNEFYFAPITIGRQDWKEGVEPEQAREEAVQFGGLNARVRYMLEHAGTEPDEPEAAVERARKLWDAVIDSYFMQAGKELRSMSEVNYGRYITEALGLPEEDAFELFRASQACRGVLLTLSTSALNEFSLTGGDGEGGTDNALLVEGGLPLKYISSITLLGDYEREQFRLLREM